VGPIGVDVSPSIFIAIFLVVSTTALSCITVVVRWLTAQRLDVGSALAICMVNLYKTIIICRW